MGVLTNLTVVIVFAIYTYIKLKLIKESGGEPSCPVPCGLSGALCHSGRLECWVSLGTAHREPWQPGRDVLILSWGQWGHHPQIALFAVPLGRGWRPDRNLYSGAIEQEGTGPKSTWKKSCSPKSGSGPAPTALPASTLR